MVRILHFIKKSEIRKYKIQKIKLELKINELIFPPSSFGIFFAKNIKINNNETVIDIGTGSGILAIISAKLGGIVFATDIDNDAVYLAKENAIKNNVNINIQKGNYFSNFDRKFDVIIANLPQDIIPYSYKKAIGKKLTKTIDGRKYGNEFILKFLDLAKSYMHNNSRIYLIVSTATDYTTTIKKAIKNYNLKIIASHSEYTKEFIEDNIEWYLKLNEVGKIKIFKKNDKWMAYDYLFELTLK